MKLQIQLRYAEHLVNLLVVKLSKSYVDSTGEHSEQRLPSGRHRCCQVQEDAGADVAHRSLHHGQSAEDGRFR